MFYFGIYYIENVFGISVTVILLTLFFHKTLTSLRVRAILNLYLLVVAILKISEEMLSRVFCREIWSGVYCSRGNNVNQAECLVAWGLGGARYRWAWHKPRSWEWIVKVDWDLDQEAQKAVLRVGNGEPLEVLNTNHVSISVPLSDPPCPGLSLPRSFLSHSCG